MLKLEQQWFAVLAFCATVMMPLPSFAATPAYISEVAWAGSSLSASDEWIEIVNETNNELDMSGWRLTGAGSKNADIVLSEGSVVSANSTFLIGNYDAQHENSALAVEPNLVTASLSLPNSGFHLHLLDNNNAVIDVAGGAGAPFAGGSGSTADALDGRYTSMVRVDGLVSGEEKSNWIDANLTQNLDENVNDFATPGMHPITERIVEEEISTLENESELETPEMEEVVEEIPAEKTIVETTVTEPTPEPEPENAEETLKETVKDKPTMEFIATEQTHETEVVTNETPSESAVVVETTEPPEEMPISETTSEPNVTEVTPLDPAKIIVSEFLAAPETDQDEWVEFQNIGEAVVDLTGWTLEDESGKQTALDGSVEAGAFFVLVKPNGKLNNSGDSIIVKNNLGEEMVSLTYGTSEVPAGKKGQSIVRDGDTYHRSEIHTPGKANLIFIPIAQVEDKQELKVEQETETTTESTDATEVETTEKETLITSIKLTSLYPNTNGKDEVEEYIKVQNTGSESISLEGWSVSDESGKQYVFNPDVDLAPSEELTIKRTESKIALNNTGDTVSLHAPNKQLIDQVTYSKSTKGETYNRNDDEWTWSQTHTTELTKENVVQAPEQHVETTTTRTSNYALTNKSIAELTALPVGSRAMVSGVVTATPNSLGKQLFYIQDETGGIQVYFYKATFPEMQVGDVISVTGELSNARGEHRLKISNMSAITHQNANQNVRKERMNLADLHNTHVGDLVEVTGMVQSKTSSKIILEHNGGTLTVHLGSSGMISTETHQRGDELVVTGIASIYDENLRIRPRSQNDIVVLEKEKEKLIPVIGSAKNSSPLSNQGQTGTFLLLLTFVVFTGLALARLIPRQKPMNA